MSPPQQLRQQTSNCSSLLIYGPRKDERLSWPSWLTYSGWLTHIHVSGHPSATSRAQTAKAHRPKINAIPLDHAVVECMRIVFFWIIAHLLYVHVTSPQVRSNHKQKPHKLHFSTMVCDAGLIQELAYTLDMKARVRF